MASAISDVFLPHIKFVLPTKRSDMVKEFSISPSNSTWDTLVNHLIKNIDTSAAKKCGDLLFLITYQGHSPTVGQFPKEFLVQTAEKTQVQFNPLTQKESDYFSLIGKLWFFSILPFLKVVDEKDGVCVLQVDQKSVEDYETFMKTTPEEVKNFFVGNHAMTGATAFWGKYLNDAFNQKLTIHLNTLFIE